MIYKNHMNIKLASLLLFSLLSGSVLSQDAQNGHGSRIAITANWILSKEFADSLKQLKSVESVKGPSVSRNVLDSVKSVRTSFAISSERSAQELEDDVIILIKNMIKKFGANDVVHNQSSRPSAFSIISKFPGGYLKVDGCIIDNKDHDNVRDVVLFVSEFRTITSGNKKKH